MMLLFPKMENLIVCKNNMKSIAFFFSKMTMGGTETLILRLMKWYFQRFYRVFLLTEHEIGDVFLLKDLEKINGGEYYIYNEQKKIFFSNVGVELTFDTNEVFVLTFCIEQFLICNRWLSKKMYKCQFVYRIYIVHFEGTYVGRKVMFLFRALLLFLLRKQIIVFMDEITINSCLEYYKITNIGFELMVLRLPMVIKADIPLKSKNVDVNLLTITRFDFPFKGYVLGLINSFGNLSFRFENLYLTIIGYGDGEYKVKQKIEALPENIRRKIYLVHKVPYSEISDYIDSCDLFIGMGTTVLDVSNRNKITIVPVAYQLGNLATGFFYDDCKNVGSVHDKSAHYFCFDDLIEQYLAFDEVAINERVNLTKSLFVEHYDIDKIAPEIINQQYHFPLHIKTHIRIIDKIYSFLKILHYKYKLFNR